MNMFEHTITTEAQVEAIWELYSDIASWVEWDKGIVHASLEGAFEAGTRGILQPEGQGPLSFVLTEVVPLGGFSDVTVIPNAGIEVHFDHRLERIAGGTRITHKVTLAGPNSETMGPRMIEHFSRGIPHTMEGIAAMALERGGRTA
jgi:hypothetical protein